MKTIVIGDVHGCLDELQKLLSLTNYSKNDRVIFVGDLIDRGPSSVEVIKFCIENNFESVLGNHEFKFLKWLKKNTIPPENKQHYKWLTKKEIDYIQSLPLYIKANNNLIVHAGINPFIPFEKQKESEELFLIRHLDKAKEVFWTSKYSEHYNIIYGHQVHSFLSPLIEVTDKGAKCYGIDTGCCFGGRLTALVLETSEIFQVNSKIQLTI